MDTPCKQKEFWTTQSLIFLSEVEDVLGSAGGSREAGSQGLTWDQGEVSLCPAQYKSLVTSTTPPHPRSGAKYRKGWDLFYPGYYFMSRGF